MWFCKIEHENAGFAQDAQTFLEDGVAAIYTILPASISHNDALSRLSVNEVILVALFLVIDNLNADSYLRVRSQNSFLLAIYICQLIFAPVFPRFGAKQFLPLIRISWSSRQMFLYRVHLVFNDRRNDQGANSYTS